MLVFSVASLPGLLVPIVASGWFARRMRPGGARLAGVRLGGVALLVLALWIGARPWMQTMASDDSAAVAQCPLDSLHGSHAAPAIGTVP